MANIAPEDEQIMATLERVAKVDPARVGALIAAGCGTAPEAFVAVFDQGKLAAARARMSTLFSQAQAFASQQNAAHYEATVAPAVAAHETETARRRQVLARLEALQGELTAGQIVNVPTWEQIETDLR